MFSLRARARWEDTAAADVCMILGSCACKSLAKRCADVSMEGLTREQRVAKIAHDIVGYDASSHQAKLSLLQDLIIETLPNVRHGSSEYMRLMSVRCHQPAENVVAWLEKLMLCYSELPVVKATLAQLESAVMNKLY